MSTEGVFSKSTMMPNQKQSRRAQGAGGEFYASVILAKDGYSILCKNYTAPGGEIDLIATKGNFICFIEVKMRSISSGQNAAQAVDNKKLCRINKCITHFFEEYRDNNYVSSLTPRIDIFEVYTSKGIVKKHNHIIGIS